MILINKQWISALNSINLQSSIKIIGWKRLITSCKRKSLTSKFLESHKNINAQCGTNRSDSEDDEDEKGYGEQTFGCQVQ